MKYQFEKYRKWNLVQIGIDAELIEKEIKEAHNDLKSAEHSINHSNYKWAIVQSYYSMFHAFRGLLISRGYKEKSHTALKLAIKNLFVNNGIINDDIYAGFDFAMEAREKADYGHVYDEKLACDIFESAKKLINEVENSF